MKYRLFGRKFDPKLIIHNSGPTFSIPCDTEQTQFHGTIYMYSKLSANSNQINDFLLIGTVMTKPFFISPYERTCIMERRLRHNTASAQLDEHNKTTIFNRWKAMKRSHAWFGCKISSSCNTWHVHGLPVRGVLFLLWSRDLLQMSPSPYRFFLFSVSCPFHRQITWCTC